MPRETTTQRKRRLAKLKLKRQEKLAKETPEEKQLRLQKKRDLRKVKKLKAAGAQSEPDWKPEQVGNLLKVRKQKYQKEKNALSDKDQSEIEWQHGLQAGSSNLHELYQKNINKYGEQINEQQKMTLTDFPTPSEITDLQADTVIKEEDDIDQTTTEDMSLDIKSEINIEETVLQGHSSDPFKHVQLQVKQEISMNRDREGNIQNDDSLLKMEDFNNEAKDDLDHYVIVPKREMDCDEKSEVKEEVLPDDSVVTYDYPNFDDVASMDSNDAAALTQVEACLQDDVNIKYEDDGGMEMRQANPMRNFKLSGDSNPVDSFQDDDDDFGSDEDDPRRYLSISDSFHTIHYRQKSKKMAKKSQSKSVGGTTVSEQTYISDTDSCSESSCNESDTDRQSHSDLESDSSQSSANTSSILNGNETTPSQLHIQEHGSGVDSSTSEENFPLAKRLKTKNLSTESPAPPVGSTANEHNESITSRHPQTTSTEEEWVSTTTPIPEFYFNADSVGVKFSVDQNTTVIDVFSHLFPSGILDYLIECTNEYGKHICGTNVPKTRHSRSYSFKPTDRGEMLKFLGLCLLSGQVNVPQKRKLFTMSDVLYYHPIFVSTMSGRRFDQLLSFLCTGPLNAKGKGKITEFMDALCRNFSTCYSPEKELSLDEPLLLFKGCLSFRQYIKSKKSKYGIKFYELAGANGYVLNVLMYAGKDESVGECRRIGKTVLRLMRPYVMKGHELFMDIHYNSLGLSQKLLDLKTHTNGMLKSNREGNPKTVIKKKLTRGEHVWARKNNVYISKWADKRPVTIITTRNHPRMINIANGRRQLKGKPVEMVIYNEFTSGNDRADQMICYYSAPRKCLKWYKKVFFHLFDLAVWNSYYIYRKYKKNNSKRYEFLHFREELIRYLINISPNKKPDLLIKHSMYDNRLKDRVVEPGPSTIHVDNSTGGHWPEKIPPAYGSKKKSNYLKCKMCAKNKIRKETGLKCKGCIDKPALCALCFEEWHDPANLNTIS